MAFGRAGVFLSLRSLVAQVHVRAVLLELAALLTQFLEGLRVVSRITKSVVVEEVFLNLLYILLTFLLL